MNIPSGYRRLVNGEIIQAGDLQQWYGASPRPVPSVWEGRATGSSGFEPMDSYQILREIVEGSPWIAISERKPEIGRAVLFSEDPQRIHSSEAEYAWVGRMQVDGSVKNSKLRGANFWMEIPAPLAVVEPVFVQEGGRGGSKHEVTFEKDGSIKVGCTTVDSTTMDKIVARRKEVMES